MNTTTKREQVEVTLKAAKFTEDAPGDWRRENACVYLDIAHTPPETAWIRMLYFKGRRMGPREVVTYDDVIRRFG